ncbi:hypothetical protein EsH8_I_000077 [Colletotrichum jinshuiense]
MQPERKYRNILPGPATNYTKPFADDNAEAVFGNHGGQEGSKRKRRATTKACNSCREKKIGCNGLQPCSHCQRRGLACEYATISKTILNSIPSGMKLIDETTAKTHRCAAELLSLLRSVTDDQVRDVLQQLRAGRDASNIVSTLRGQLHSVYDFSFHGSLHAVPPPNQKSLEFELMNHRYQAYELKAAAWSYAFYDEATQILQHETAMGLATPSTVAALLYLSMSSTCHAKDTADATDHLEHAVDLAKSIGLFGIADEGMVERWPDGASDFLWEKSMAQTAWGSFVYITTYFHASVLDLFRPLIHHGDAMRFRLKSFTTQQASPEAFGIHQFPLEYNPVEKLANLRTCILGYQKLQHCFRLSRGIIRSLLSMALREGLVASPEARAIIKDSNEKGKHHPGSDEVVAPFIVDLDLATVNPAAAHVDRLAAEFDELAIFNEFTVIPSAREAQDFSNEGAGLDAEG